MRSTSHRYAALGCAIAASFATCGLSGVAAGNDNPSLYLAGRVLSVDDRDTMVTVTIERNDATPSPALARFAVPKTNDRATQDDVVLMLGSATVADRAVPRWRVEVASRATLAAWSVAPFSVGDTIAVVGYAANGSDKSKPRDSLRAQYLIGNGKVVPLRALPR